MTLKSSKKGFTIVELLAIVLIMAMIAIIVTPQIQKIILNAKYKTSKESIQGYIREANIKSTTSFVSTNGIRVTDDKYIFETGNDEDELGKINLKGTYPTYAYIRYNHDAEVEYGRFCINGYSIIFENGDFTDSTIDYCTKEYTETPVVTITNTVTKSNSAEISFSATSTNAISSYTCEYGETSVFGEDGTITGHTCNIKDLGKNRIYYYKVCAINNKGKKGCRSGYVYTNNIATPTLTYTNNPTTPQNGYLKSQTIGISYNTENVITPEFYVKSSRKGTLSGNTIASCGNTTVPYNCTNSSVSTIEKGVWYKVSGNVSVTYNEDSATTGTIEAILSDGTDYTTSVTGVISKIYNGKPSIDIKGVATTSNSIVLSYSLVDTKAGIKSYTCKYGTTNGSYTTNASSVTNSNCTLTGLNSSTTYYYQVCATNGLGYTECRTGSSSPTGITKPVITYQNDPETPQNGYLKSQTLNVSYGNTGITNPGYYIKVTKAGRASMATLQACGTGSTPSGCSNSAVTDLVANTWYKVSGNIGVTYDSTSNATGTLYALISDGSNTNSSSAAISSKIDRENPVVTLGTYSSTSNSLTINYTMSDAKSGVGSYTCKYGTSAGSYTTAASAQTDTLCKLTGLERNTVYYYQICAYDKLGNGPTCVTDSKRTNDIVVPTFTYKHYKADGTETSEAPNGYRFKQVITAVFDRTHVDNPEYYIMSARAADTNLNTIQHCEFRNNKMMNCIIDSTKRIQANTWYKVSGNIEVTYNENATETSTLRAAIFDGNNLVGSAPSTVSKIDVEYPTVTLGSYTSTTNSVVLTYTLDDIKSGVGTLYTCKYSTDTSYNKNGNSVTNNSCTITGLKNNTKYNYQICVTDKVLNGPTCKTGEFWTKQFVDIKITNNISPTTAVNGYVKEQTLQVDFDATNVTDPKYFIKVTRADGTTNIDLLEKCGNGTTPGTCSTNTSSNKKLTEANIWYRVAGDINVFYNKTVTSTGTIYAYISDGNNYGGAATATIAKNDDENPTISNVSAASTTNSITISYTLSDNYTGISDYTCKYSATNGTYNINGNSIKNNQCVITGLTNNKTYYYQICAKDGVKNGYECKTGSKGTQQSRAITVTSTLTPNPAVNGYVRSQSLAVDFDPTYITSPTYYIKSSKKVNLSNSTSASCGTGTNPSVNSCSSSTVTTMEANTWYKVAGDITVINNINSTSTGTLYFIMHDGTNFLSSGSTATLAKVESGENPVAPVIQGGTGASTWVYEDRTISVKTAGSALSGVETYEYYKSTSSSTPSASATATGTTSGNVTINTEGTWYIWYRTKSKAGNRSGWSNREVVNLEYIKWARQLNYSNSTYTTCSEAQCAIDDLANRLRYN